MNALEAEKILNAYGKVLENEIPKISDLPCSRAKIKFAYYAYLLELHKRRGRLMKDGLTDLVLTYGMLNHLVSDKQAKEYEAIQVNLDKQLPSIDGKMLKKYIHWSTNLYDEKLLDEINEYIDEIQAGKL